MNKADYDLCVIGGGINGAGIARDAAGRGLSVLLVEAKDLAAATSSSSTKLIHGGLRYLEYFEFSMVREALKEREVLLSIAPHLIRPMDFVLPHMEGQRPFWMIRLGLFLYDHLARRRVLKGSKALDFRVHAAGACLEGIYERGFQYSDCWADDARLVVLNAVDAARRGAEVLTHTPCTALEPDGRFWDVHLFDENTKQAKTVRASMVVNAAGPWVSDMLQRSGIGQDDDNLPKTRLVKGSHIITERLFDGDQSYILQQSDGRICFAIPYEDNYTLIGTTEEDYNDDPYQAGLSDDEMTYLVAAYNGYFSRKISKDDVLWSYSGVRPLFDDGDADATSVTRDYKLYMHPGCDAPLLSIFGGKLTTYRVLAEDVLETLLHLDNRYAPRWTADEPLPGGGMRDGDFDAFLAQQFERYDWMPIGLVERYARSYGTCMDKFLRGAKGVKDLGKHFGDNVYEAEVVYLLQHEFAQSLEDILWRRTKLGLHVDNKTIKNIAAFLESYNKKAKRK